MRAQVLRAPGELTLEERPQPEPRGEALIRIAYSGICGTDVKIYQGGIPARLPLVMGHEMIGELVAGGQESSLRPGERVIVDPVLYCGTCFNCREAKQHLCPERGLLGRDHDGGFAEYLRAPASHVHLLPDGIEMRLAPLIQVLTTVVHAQRLAPIFPGESVVVLGLGVTGQLHVQLARARGARPIIGITRSPRKRELAATLGADVTLPPGEEAREAVRDVTEGRGADLVIEAVGKAATLAEAMQLARVGGRVLVFGIVADQGSLPPYQGYYKELDIRFSRAAQARDFPTSIKLVEQGRVQLEPLVSHELRLEELGKGLQLLQSPDAEALKVIIEHT